MQVKKKNEADNTFKELQQLWHPQIMFVAECPPLERWKIFPYTMATDRYIDLAEYQLFSALGKQGKTSTSEFK